MGQLRCSGSPRDERSSMCVAGQLHPRPRAPQEWLGLASTPAPRHCRACLQGRRAGGEPTRVPWRLCAVGKQEWGLGRAGQGPREGTHQRWRHQDDYLQLGPLPRVPCSVGWGRLTKIPQHGFQGLPHGLLQHQRALRGFRQPCSACGTTQCECHAGGGQGQDQSSEPTGLPSWGQDGATGGEGTHTRP